MVYWDESEPFIFLNIIYIRLHIRIYTYTYNYCICFNLSILQYLIIISDLINLLKQSR